MRDRSSGRDDRRSRAPEALNDGFAYAFTATGYQRAFAGEFGFGESTHPRILLRLPTAAKGRVAGPARTSARRILPRSNALTRRGAALRQRTSQPRSAVRLSLCGARA